MPVLSVHAAAGGDDPPPPAAVPSAAHPNLCRHNTSATACFGGIIIAVSVVVQPDAPAIATGVAPKESTFTVSPVPLFVVVVV